MKKEAKPMLEIHKIQERIYEEQKSMTDKEKLEAIQKEAEEARKKYGLKIRKRKGDVLLNKRAKIV